MKCQKVTKLPVAILILGFKVHNNTHSMKELYSILGLPRGSSDNDVKKAYRKLALKVSTLSNFVTPACLNVLQYSQAETMKSFFLSIIPIKQAIPGKMKGNKSSKRSPKLTLFSRTQP